jgi:tripartite-type tricarboxylate transporter receptor subunit TctC
MRLLLSAVVAGLAVLAGLPVLAGSATAQTYPSKPIHILIPYAPGGIADIAARIIGAKLTEAWGQQVVVENKPGGNGFIAMTAGAKAAPDGYTLVMATVGDVSVNPSLFKDMPYKWEDFAPIAAISDAPMVLATNANTPYKSVADVLAAAKAQPGRISYASPGNGSVNQIAMEWLSLNTGTQYQHIPYKGGAPASAALAAGDIPLGVLASSSVAPQVKAGRLRVLAVTGAKPSKFSPEWPTLQSQGVKDVDLSNWTLLIAPKGTPKEIVDKLNAEVGKILNIADVKERFAAGGVETIPSSAAELDARVKQTAAQLSAIVEKAKIKAD